MNWRNSILLKKQKRQPSKYRKVKCVICGKIFLTNHSQGKYCSIECKKEKNKVIMKQYYQKNKEKIKYQTTLYHRSLAGKITQKIKDIRRRKKHPEKYQAQQEVLKALRKGILIKQPCSICGSTLNIEAHHPDYNKPLNVVWLCRDCHKIIHKIKIIEEEYCYGL